MITLLSYIGLIRSAEGLGTVNEAVVEGPGLTSG